VGWQAGASQPTSVWTPESERRTLGGPGPSRPHLKGSVMPDKSPRQSLGKKSNETLKQKRAAKRAKSDQTMPIVTVQKIRHR
jgi:hypothetical protein